MKNLFKFSSMASIILLLLSSSCTKENPEIESETASPSQEGPAYVVGGDARGRIIRISNTYLLSEYEEISEGKYKWTYANSQTNIDFENAIIKKTFPEIVKIQSNVNGVVQLRVESNGSSPALFKLKNIEKMGSVFQAKIYTSKDQFVANLYVNDVLFMVGISSNGSGPVIASAMCPLGAYKYENGKVLPIGGESSYVPAAVAAGVYLLITWAAKLVDIYCEDRVARQVKACTEAGRCSAVITCGARCVPCQ